LRIAKGPLLPPGSAFNALSEKALSANKSARFAEIVLGLGRNAEVQSLRIFPYTPATTLLYGLRESASDASRRGPCETSFAATSRHAELREPPCALGPGNCLRERANIRILSRRFSCRPVTIATGFAQSSSRISICRSGAGLSKLARKVFRIGHLGSFNDLLLAGTLCAGVVMDCTIGGGAAQGRWREAALHSLAPRNRAAETAKPVR